MNRLINYFLSSVLIFPFVLIYLLLFQYGNDFTRDREVYIQQIMANPFSGREEPGLHFISYILGSVVYNPELKFMIVHILFLFLFLFSLSKEFSSWTIVGFSKYLFFFMICLSVLSNPFGIQVRIGYGCILFCFIVFALQLRPTIKNIPWFVLPCLMHMGLIIGILFYYMFYWLKIDNIKKFLTLIFFLCFFLTFVLRFLERIIYFFGISDYYLVYLADDQDFGRAVPFTVLFYIIACIFMLFLKDRLSQNIDFWYAMSGVVLIYLGWGAGFYLSFKFLAPIAFFLYIYLTSKIILNVDSAKILIVLSILVSPIVYFYFCLQTGYFD